MGNVTGGDFAFAGGLAALNAAGTTIESSYATGSVTAGGLASAAGGLVGENLGSIAASHATGLVTVGDGGWAGGLAGQNLGGIATSYATGVITVGDGGWAGGLAGQNFANAAITASHAEGNVIAGNSAVAGGLVGSNGTGAGIANSYATGSVVAGSMAASAGGLAGQNLGLIATSHSTGIVTVGNAGWAGGLVGSNGAGSEIGNSYATGAPRLEEWPQRRARRPEIQALSRRLMRPGSLQSETRAGPADLSARMARDPRSKTPMRPEPSLARRAPAGSRRWAGSPAPIKGLISGSWASGNVGSPLIANLQAGGLAGSNSGYDLVLERAWQRAGGRQRHFGRAGCHQPGNDHGLIGDRRNCQRWNAQLGWRAGRNQSGNDRGLVSEWRRECWLERHRRWNWLHSTPAASPMR